MKSWITYKNMFFLVHEYDDDIIFHPIYYCHDYIGILLFLYFCFLFYCRPSHIEKDDILNFDFYYPHYFCVDLCYQNDDQMDRNKNEFENNDN